MYNLFVPPDQIRDDIARISGEERHHIHVLRLRVGDEVRLLDGTGGIYEGVISTLRRDEAVVKILRRYHRRSPARKVYLYQGLPKGEKLDLIIQKATELGVYSVTPVICRRSIPRIEANKIPDRLRRWNKIAVEACKQCGRVFLPRLNRPRSFDEVLGEVKADLRLMLWEGEREKRLRDALKRPLPKSVAVLIGPEGGFEEMEVRSAVKAGFQPVSLGELTLRTETAAIASLSIIQYELGLLG
ncbi:TPA: 16S rRNA (uracil(1498)-N(3))-methyltransferase [Candidatus Poribacteria bacterium]|nr:16S rRNA (uracil(1498)-N(3))-methyltransferase [Candidatus Poribacteria bacterium]